MNNKPNILTVILSYKDGSKYYLSHFDGTAKNLLTGNSKKIGRKAFRNWLNDLKEYGYNFEVIKDLKPGHYIAIDGKEKALFGC